jgi:hypothetical protein
METSMLRNRVRAISLIVTASVIAAACSSAAPSSPGSSAAAETPIASAAGRPPVADPLKSDFKLNMDKPVLVPGGGATWYPVYNGPAAALYADGKFHVFHDGASNVQQSLGYKYSTDGVNFSAPSPDDPILTPDMIYAAGLDMTGNLNIGTVLVDGKQWVMYFTAGSSDDLAPGTFHGSIGRATAPTPTGPWKLDPKPVLEPGATGAWDALPIGYASVVRAGERWVMYYSQGAGIGMATSADGLAWTRYDDPGTTEALYAHGDPVLQDDGSGKYVPLVGDKVKVAQVGSGWIMTYEGSSGGIEYSTSVDGLHWTPAIKIVDTAQIRLSIYLSALVVHDGTAYLYIEAGGQSSNGYLATWKA